jgi:hypothetical protein
MAEAIQPVQMQNSTDHKKENSTLVQIYHPWTGTEQSKLRQIPGFEPP